MRAVLLRNGLPDGFMVRLANLDEKHFPTATRVEEMPDGSIEIWFDRIFLNRYAKGEHLSHWPVVKELPKRLRKR